MHVEFVAASDASRFVGGRSALSNGASDGAYGRSKIALVMFTRELHRRFGGFGVSAASFHPGFVNSNFGPASGSRVLAVMERAHTERLVGISPEAACDQLVWLASEEAEDFDPAGEYFVKRRVGRAHRTTYAPRLGCELWVGRLPW